MDWRIFIEGKELDAPKDFSAQFTYTIDDIKEFSSRNTSFSKTIVIPGTGKNNFIFGHVFEVGSANFVNPANPNVYYDYDASRAAKCVILQDGLLIFKGILRILEIVVDGEHVEYETAVFGELGGLIAALGDKKLEQLDFSAYDHTYNELNVINTWIAPFGGSYFYPLIDYGYSVDKITFPFENFKPAFYLKEYVHKILTAAGYTYTSNFFNTTFFKSLIVPFKDQYFGKPVSTVLQATDVSTAFVFSTSGVVQNFDTIVGTPYLTPANSNTKFIYERIDPITVKLNYTGNYSIAGGNTFTLKVMKNGTDSLFEIDLPPVSGTISFSLVITLDRNDYLEIRAFEPSNGPVLTITNATLTISGQPTVQVPVAYGETVIANEAIPKNVLQKDFLASVIKLFNLYLDEDKLLDKHLMIEPYINYYDNAPVINWNDKIDRKSPYRLRPLGEMNSRVYEFKYKDDSDFYNNYYKTKFGETYGTYTLDTGSEFVKDKKTVDLIFSPTPLVGYSNNDRVISAILKRSDSGVDSATTCNIRLLARTVSPIACQEWHAETVANGTFDFFTYPYAGHLDNPDAPTFDLNFGAPQEFYFKIITGYLSANMFNVYWSWYMSEITDKDSKMFLGKLKLTPQDIAQLDFKNLIFMLGVLWRLHKVNDYNTSGDEVTNCELLKVIDVVI